MPRAEDIASAKPNQRTRSNRIVDDYVELRGQMNGRRSPPKPAPVGVGVEQGFWDWALKRSPKPARFVLGGYLLLAASGLVLAWRLSTGSLLVTAVVVLVCSLVVALLVRSLGRPQAHGPLRYCFGAWLCSSLLCSRCSSLRRSLVSPRGDSIRCAHHEFAEVLMNSETASLLLSEGACPRRVRVIPSGRRRTFQGT